jgi:hypothetical protein
MMSDNRLQSAILMVLVLVGGSFSGRSGICSTFVRVVWPLNKQINHTRQRINIFVSHYTYPSPNELVPLAITTQGPTNNTNKMARETDAAETRVAAEDPKGEDGAVF